MAQVTLKLGWQKSPFESRTQDNLSVYRHFSSIAQNQEPLPVPEATRNMERDYLKASIVTGQRGMDSN